MSTDTKIQVGLEVFIANPDARWRSARLGLLMNQASVDSQFRYACDVIALGFPGQLRKLFSPQHGLWCEQQANMIESNDGWYQPLDLTVFSLYSETRRPTQEMLCDIDCLVIDLQDVGTRVYTFIWTMLECLHACASAGVAVIVLDRPNPLGGVVVEGPILNPDFRSFVGNASIPLRHGLTIGELARLFVREASIPVELNVIPMQGWQREFLYGDTGRIWVAPSPNMQRCETTILYPGQVLLEGTSLSEGRGTTLPFEVSGSVKLDPHELVEKLKRFEHPGLRLRPIRYKPTFDKWANKSCGGVAFHIIDPGEVRSVKSTVALLATVQDLQAEALQWLPPPYEYELIKPPIDILFGDDRLRTRLDQNQLRSPQDIEELLQWDETAWRSRAEEVQLYK